MITRLILVSVITVITIGIFSAQAADSYADNPQAIQWMHRLAQRDGYDQAYLLSLLGAVSRDDEVLAKISRPAEKIKPWYEYKNIFSDTQRTENGKQFFAAHRAVLNRAASVYGVDLSVIVAILGVETRYGKLTGTTPVFRALATLCFDYPPRADFFCQQLDYFLRFAKREDKNPLSLLGSYAGAMGMPQFMPSSYYDDAIDFDGDGSIDLWHSTADVIGSVAHYLAKRGWQKNGPYIQLLPVKPDLASFAQTHKPQIAIKRLLQDKNLKNDRNIIQRIGKYSGEKVGGLILDVAANEKQYWLTYNNFYVITRYNTSPLYAMAVIELANRIKLNQQESK